MADDLWWILLQFEGRIPRHTFWVGTIGVAVAYYAVTRFITRLFGGDVGLLSMVLLYIPLLWMTMALQIKRWHDRDKSGWWCLVSLVPVAGPVWSLIELGLLPGTRGPNAFGPIETPMALRTQWGSMEAASMPNEHDYDIRLDVKYGLSTLIDVGGIASSVEPWFNQTLTQVNDCVVRLGVLHGDFHWHHHENEDEFFYVLEGELLIDLEGETITLGPKQGYTVPRGVQHRTRAPERTVLLMVEAASVQPTGD